MTAGITCDLMLPDSSGRLRVYICCCAIAATVAAAASCSSARIPYMCLHKQQRLPRSTQTAHQSSPPAPGGLQAGRLLMTDELMRATFRSPRQPSASSRLSSSQQIHVMDPKGR
ncbi:hypothetical protein THAOC_14897 [Thalassiosira oceanica]|uniref:Uncharacterized protein n=1 Tax=Thalassiosira oceanica TaxID=159749 RepID=K0SG94_THAOC|nr:hypothetical protein THAOC_14897 [Thalassiosira oceanica]|eukprot:EJK64375.1 hypothetical protein THAOC_14897 [Thalassiosira oceanica]